MKRIVRLLLFNFLLLQSSVYPAVVIFDMGGVLVQKSTFWTCWYIGFSKLLGFYNPFSLEQTFFDFLDKLEARRPETSQAMHNGKLIPQLMCDWQLGLKTSQEIEKLLTDGFRKHTNFFSTRAQQHVIEAVAQLTFDPQQFAKVMIPLKDGIKLQKKCARKKDKFGKPLNRIFILSNWDAESFPLLYNNRQLYNMFKRCEGIMISGNAHLMKPDPTFFEILFKTYNIDPNNELTVFIDDEECNILAAHGLGYQQLHPILCRKNNFKVIKKELKRLGVL